MERCDRKGLVSRIREGCSPLFIACKKGNVEIVEYLMGLCDADLEQRGLYEVQDDRSVKTQIRNISIFTNLSNISFSDLYTM